jgi:hypothetical protein
VNSSSLLHQRQTLDRWALWLLGSPGLAIAFLWGLAEGTFFFIIPDVFLSLVAIMDLRQSWKHILCALLGATLGGAILFHWAEQNPSAAHAAVVHVPFVRESMFTLVQDGFGKNGPMAMAIGSVSGLPYKLYAVEAPEYCSAATFLLATPPARAVRFLLVWFGFGATAAWLRRSRGMRTTTLLKIYAAIWFASYALYWGRILSG